MGTKYYKCTDQKAVQDMITEQYGSQTAFAKSLGVFQPDISRILHGRCAVSDDRLEKLSDALGEDLSLFFIRYYPGRFKTEKERQEICHLRESGISCEQIAKRYHCNAQSVRNVVREDQNVNMGPLSDSEKAMIEEMYQNGSSKQEIAHTLNRAVRTVYRYLKVHHGNEERYYTDKSHKGRHKLFNTPDEQNAVKEMYLSGSYPSDIAGQYGCNPATIERVLRESLGPDYKTKYPHPRKVHVATSSHKQEMARMRREGASVQNIADRFHCSTMSVYHMLKDALGNDYGTYVGKRTLTVSTQENVWKTVGMKRNGVSVRNIAKELRCSESSVYNMIRAGRQTDNGGN